MALRLSILFIICLTSLQAAGTSAEGWAIVRLTKLERNGGLIWSSYEGIVEVAGWDEDEDCNEDDQQCYKPQLDSFDISVREIDENKNLINFMKENTGKEMIIHYKRHRFEAAKLSSNTEILEAFPQGEQIPPDLDRIFKAEKKGDKKEFDVYGRFLRIEKRGIAIKTWEGLYLDRKRRKVHPFSVTNEAMAKHIARVIRYLPEFHFGVAVHYFSVSHETPYDIFEVNYNGLTGKL